MSETGILRNAAQAGRFRSWAATHNGTVRDHNEDAFVNRPDLGLWAVADGAGGHQSGEIASSRVADALEAIPPGLSGGQVLSEVRQRLDAAHASLWEEGQRRGAGAIVATTVVVVLARDGHFACLWAGDSRAYLLRDGELSQVTRDHSLVQELFEAGAITEDEIEGHPHANVITRAVGADAGTLDLEKCSDRLLAGDRLLMCSDGLCKTLPDAEIAGLLAADEDAAAERLVMAALVRGATDNVTAVLVQVVAG